MTTEGVVVGVEKKVQSMAKLQEPINRSNKIVEIDSHCACAVTGIIGDAKPLIDHARVECQNHRFNMNEPLNIDLITQAVSD